MRTTKGAIFIGCAAVAVAGAICLACVLRKGPELSDTQATAEAQESAVETAAMLEYVTDENWDALLEAYKAIESNLDKAKAMTGAGLADPNRVVERASELLESGKNCERDSLLNSEAQELLGEMESVAGELKAILYAGGNEPVDASINEPMDAQEAGSTDEDANPEDGQNATSEETIADSENTEATVAEETVGVSVEDSDERQAAAEDNAVAETTPA